MGFIVYSIKVNKERHQITSNYTIYKVKSYFHPVINPVLILHSTSDLGFSFEVNISRYPLRYHL